MSPLASLVLVIVALVALIQWRLWAWRRRVAAAITDEREAAEFARWAQAMRAEGIEFAVKDVHLLDITVTYT